jgi:hypothetical protein
LFGSRSNARTHACADRRQGACVINRVSQPISSAVAPGFGGAATGVESVTERQPHLDATRRRDAAAAQPAPATRQLWRWRGDGHRSGRH